MRRDCATMDASNEHHLAHCIVYEILCSQQGRNNEEAYKNLSKVFGKTLLSWTEYSSFHKRYGKRKHPDSPPPSPAEQRSEALIDENGAKSELEKNPCLIIWEIAETLKSRQKINSDRMQKPKYMWKSASWASNILSEKNLNDRIKMCRTLRKWNTVAPFLDRLIIADEIWITYKQIVRKREYDEPGSSSSFISKSSLNKIKLCIWWDVRGLIWFEVLKPDEKLDSERYNKQLDELKNVLVEKRRGMVQKKRAIVLYDKAKLFTDFGMRMKLEAFGYEIMLQPPYSLDLVPSAYHLFPRLQHFLDGREFNNEADFKKTLTNYLNNKDESFYKDGLYKLPIRWQDVINNDGHYLSY